MKKIKSLLTNFIFIMSPWHIQVRVQTLGESLCTKAENQSCFSERFKYGRIIREKRVWVRKKEAQQSLRKILERAPHGAGTIFGPNVVFTVDKSFPRKEYLSERDDSSSPPEPPSREQHSTTYACTCFKCKEGVVVLDSEMGIPALKHSMKEGVFPSELRIVIDPRCWARIPIPQGLLMPADWWNEKEKAFSCPSREELDLTPILSMVHVHEIGRVKRGKVHRIRPGSMTAQCGTKLNRLFIAKTNIGDRLPSKDLCRHCFGTLDAIIVPQSPTKGRLNT